MTNELKSTRCQIIMPFISFLYFLFCGARAVAVVIAVRIRLPYIQVYLLKKRKESYSHFTSNNQYFVFRLYAGSLWLKPNFKRRLRLLRHFFPLTARLVFNLSSIFSIKQPEPGCFGSAEAPLPRKNWLCTPVYSFSFCFQSSLYSQVGTYQLYLPT